MNTDETKESVEISRNTLSLDLCHKFSGIRPSDCFLLESSKVDPVGLCVEQNLRRNKQWLNCLKKHPQSVVVLESLMCWTGI